MKCRHCESINVLEGTLEGVSFLPSSKVKKFFATGLYGIKTTLCFECGKLNDLHFDQKAILNFQKHQK